MVDVGWYRTTIRSFEREIFNIPNSVFSRNVVLNVTRKGKEWRFYEFIGKLSALLHLDIILTYYTRFNYPSLCVCCVDKDPSAAAIKFHVQHMTPFDPGTIIVILLLH